MNNSLDLRPFARRALQDGTSFFPTGPDKLPLLDALPQVEQTNRKTGRTYMTGTWKPFQERHPTTDEVEDWFTNPDVTGFAAITGDISDNLVALDFEWRRFYDCWCELVPERYREPLTEKETGKGNHVAVRVDGDVRAENLAWSASNFDKSGKNKVAVELLAGHKPMMMPPSLYSTDGRRYKRTRGSHGNFQHISLDHWQTLVEYARQVSEYTPPPPEPKPVYERREQPVGGGIVDQFNERYTPDDILQEKGYRWNARSSAMIPPGSENNTASVHILEGKDGLLRSYHHSTADELYNDDKSGYTAFQLFCKLQHDDEFDDAAQAAAGRLGIIWHNRKAEVVPAVIPSIIHSLWTIDGLTLALVPDTRTIVLVDTLEAAQALQRQGVAAAYGPRAVWPQRWTEKLTAYPRRFVCFTPPNDGLVEQVALGMNAQVTRLPFAVDDYFTSQGGSLVEFANYLKTAYAPMFRFKKRR